MSCETHSDETMHDLATEITTDVRPTQLHVLLSCRGNFV